MDVFVTGGSGFVGGALIRALVARGDRVRALARSDTALRAVVAAGAEAVPGDLLDAEALLRGIEGCETVFHSAALLSFWDREAEQRLTNVMGTRCVLEAARAAGARCVVYVGAAAAVSDGGPIREPTESAARPERAFGPYARTKAEAEALVLAASDARLRTVALRPPAIWGPGDPSFLPTLVRAARRRQLVWIGGGEFPWSTCHVANVVEGALAAEARGAGGAVYALTDGPPWTFRRFVTALLATQGVAASGRSLPRPAARMAARGLELAYAALRRRDAPPLHRSLLALVGEPVELSDARARAELGYRAAMDRETGLAELEVRGAAS
jgi:nucleoside-diphosphate-sugar epimerase